MYRVLLSYAHLFRTLRSLSLALLLSSLALFSLAFAVQSTTDAGKAEFRAGNFRIAKQRWQSTLSELSVTEDAARYTDTLVLLALAHLALGESRQAQMALERAHSIVENREDALREAMVLSHLGDLYLTRGEPQKAWTYLKQAAASAEQAADTPLLQANVLNKQGNVRMAQGEYMEALSLYKKSIEVSEKGGDPVLTAKTSVNIVETILQIPNSKQLDHALNTALQKVKALPDSHDKAFALISLAHLMRNTDAPLLLGVVNKRRLEAYNALSQALKIGKALQNTRIESYARGSLAQLYADEDRNREALRLTAQAIALARLSPDLLSRWERQFARLLKKKGDLEGAIDTLHRTLKVQCSEDLTNCKIHALPYTFHNGYRSASAPIQTQKAVYLELVDVLLLKATRENIREDVRQRTLLEILKLIELFNTTALREYLGCKPAAPEEQPVLKQTAVLYPVLLDDRIELLLRLPDGIRQFTVSKVNAKEIENKAQEFRQKLENYSPEQILLYGIEDLLQDSQQLYGWLIKPVAETLEVQHVETLVIVLHSTTLSSIPFSALHDGKGFLIQKYALAATPGSLLAASTPVQRDHIQVLLAGLSFSELAATSYVNEEIRSIQELWGGDVLLDNEFVSAALRDKLEHKPYSIIHLATQTQFDRDPNKSFLYTYNYEKFKIKKLEQLIRFNNFRKSSLDLITFSASQTAQGDERAVLGLAGTAIAAGARSALASLWSVSDAATVQLMSEFYRQLKKEPELSKAKALQLAQRQLLEDYEHPYFWAAFVLIGNWL